MKLYDLLKSKGKVKEYEIFTVQFGNDGNPECFDGKVIVNNDFVKVYFKSLREEIDIDIDEKSIKDRRSNTGIKFKVWDAVATINGESESVFWQQFENYGYMMFQILRKRDRSVTTIATKPFES